MSRTCAIVGVGGLGAPAAALLAEMGSWDLRLIDDDRVELSNLPRQPLFGHADLDCPKVTAASRHLGRSRNNPSVEPLPERLTESNADRLLARSKVVIDGSDQIATKRLLNRWCCRNRTALIHAGALGWDGQLTTILPGKSACLDCLFTDLDDGIEAGSCEQEGILGPVVGAVGLAAAREADAVLRGHPPPLAGRIGILDGRTARWRSIRIPRRPNCATCGELA